MKIVFAACVFFVAATTAHAGDYCNEPRNASTEFCVAVKKSEEALQKVRELLEKSKEIQKEIDRQLDQKHKEIQKE